MSSLDVDNFQAAWSDADNAWWLRSALLRRRVRKALRQAVHAREKPDAEQHLPRLAEIRRLDGELERYAPLEGQTDGLWCGLGTVQGEANTAIAVTERIRAALAGFAATPEALMNAHSAIRRLLTEGSTLLGEGASVGKAAHAFLANHRDLNAKLERLCALTGSSIDELVNPDVEDWSRALAGKLSQWSEQQNRLHSWCAWRRVRDEAMAQGLASLVQSVESGAIETGRVSEAFEVNYCRWWISAVVDDDDVLRQFVPAEHERAIEEFVRLDEQFTELTQGYIRASLCAQLPTRDEVTRNSEWGILKRELEKKKRHKPLRQLVKEMPTALTRLTPCLLMSPLSIAQYLSAGQAKFDVVIFDEASQIPVWDAIGAIARGKQAVVVGDRKQLPPTTFFERGEEDDGEEEVERDLESILDECIAAQLPLHRLNWHYRSRHESLIAFSNHRYYGGGLVTFPAPVTEDRAVRYHHVPEGVYEKGGARTNQAEAKALISDIVRRLKDPAFCREELSIGVVTFNNEQQRLIEDLFDAERRNDPSIEPWFDDTALEPIMVKNLESVQGDERDIISQ